MQRGTWRGDRTFLYPDYNGHYKTGCLCQNFQKCTPKSKKRKFYCGKYYLNF